MIRTSDPPPPSQAVDTSREAARGSLPTQTKKQNEVLLHLYDDYRGADMGLSADRIDELTGWGAPTVTPRLWELCKRGLIYRCTNLRVPTRRKRWAHPYRLTGAGVEVMRKR